ncbi:MAG: DUF3147 family protein [Cyanobacteriota bacterium]
MSAFLVFKIILSGVIIGVITEISKKYTLLGGLIAAMPLTTLLSLFWIYYESRDYNLLANFSKSVFWGIFPTLLFFIPLIFLFKKEVNFYLVLLAGFTAFAIGAYFHQTLLK